MYCKTCGAKLPEDAKFCPECGNSAIDRQESSYSEESKSGKIGIVSAVCTGISLILLFIPAVFRAYYFKSGGIYGDSDWANHLENFIEGPVWMGNSFTIILGFMCLLGMALSFLLSLIVIYKSVYRNNPKSYKYGILITLGSIIFMILTAVTGTIQSIDADGAKLWLVPYILYYIIAVLMVVSLVVWIVTFKRIRNRNVEMVITADKAEGNKQIIIVTMLTIVVIVAVGLISNTIAANRRRANEVLNAIHKSLSEGTDSNVHGYSLEDKNDVKDASLEPVGYNPDLFEICNGYSAHLGKAESTVLDSYPNCVRKEFDTGDILWDVITAKEGQHYLLAKEAGTSYTQVFIVDENNVVVGYDYVTDMQPIDTFIKDIDTDPRSAEYTSGNGSVYHILCWRLKYGYRFIPALDVNGVYYSNGFQDLVDPTQYTQFGEVVYSPIEVNMDEPAINFGLLTSMRGNYQCKDDRIHVQLEAQDGFYRSIINASDGEKDYFYLDVVEEVENLDNEGTRYLFRAKCGETKLGYLYDCATNSLYFNVVDNWNFNDRYYENSKYVFSIEGVLPYLERKMGGTYNNNSEGVSVSIKQSGILRTVGNQLYHDKYCGYERVDDQTYFIKVMCNDQECSYLFVNTLNESEGKGVMSLYFSESNGWVYDTNYIANAKYSFSEEYEYVDVSKDSTEDKQDISDEVEGENDNSIQENAGELWYPEWLEGSAHEEELPSEVYNIIKGEYSAVANGKTFKIISETQMLYSDGDDVELDIMGCEGDNGTLYIYVSSSDDSYYSNNIFGVFYDEAGRLTMCEGSGTWDTDNNHWTASGIKVD